MRYVISKQYKIFSLVTLVILTAGCAAQVNSVQTSSATHKHNTKPQQQVSMVQNNGVEIKQVNRQFVISNQLVQSVNVKVGETILFRNADDTAHNVFSGSELKTFDLGSFMPGEVRSVSFEKKGNALVECAIHPQMQLDVTVN